VRPTSETVIGEFMAKWVQSYPATCVAAQPVGQRRAVYLRPPLFLRTSEFLWQEGHTAHADHDDPVDYARRILHEAYEDLMVNVLAVPVLGGPQDQAGTVRRRDQHADLRGDDLDGKALADGAPRTSWARTSRRPSTSSTPRPRVAAARVDDLVGVVDPHGPVA